MIKHMWFDFFFFPIFFIDKDRLLVQRNAINSTSELKSEKVRKSESYHNTAYDLPSFAFEIALLSCNSAGDRVTVPAVYR